MDSGKFAKEIAGKYAGGSKDEKSEASEDDGTDMKRAAGEELKAALDSGDGLEICEAVKAIVGHYKGS